MALALLARQMATTIHDYLKGAVDAMSRKRKLLAMLRSLGKITFNHGGTACDWGVEYQEGSMEAYSGNFTFVPVNRFRRAELGWGGYDVTDAVQEKERLTNQGKAGLIKVYSEMGMRIERDMRKQFPQRLLLADSNAQGSELEIAGLETFFSISGAEAGLEGAVGVNDDTYAGIQTAGGAYGGQWEEDSNGDSIWPLGTGPTVYDFWRPLVLLYDSDYWQGATTTWENNCEAAMSFGIDNSMRNDDADGMLSMILLWRDGYTKFKNVQRAKERINVSTDSPLYKLGFRDMLNFDGVDVTSDFDVPNEVGYGLPVNVMELMSQLDTLFRVRDDHDLASDSHRFVCDFQGQLKCESIRHFVKWRKTPE